MGGLTWGRHGCSHELWLVVLLALCVGSQLDGRRDACQNDGHGDGAKADIH